MLNRAIIIRFVIGAQLAHFFGCWLELIPETNAIFSGIRPLPVEVLWTVCGLGFFASACFAFGRLTKISALLMLSGVQLILILYFWLKETHWYLAGILVIHLLYGVRNGRFTTLFWRKPFMLAIYFGFTISGLSKAFYSGWWDGSVILALLTTHTVGPGWPADFVQMLPYKWIGYFTLVVESLSFPLALWPRSRNTIWWLNNILHFGILAWWRIGPVALGTLITQLLLYPGRDEDLLEKPSVENKTGTERERKKK